MRFNLHQHKISSLTPFLDAVGEIGLVAIIAWALSRFIKIGEKEYLKSAANRLMQNKEDETAQGKVDKTTVQAVAKLLRLSVVITALIIIQTLGYSISLLALEVLEVSLSVLRRRIRQIFWWDDDSS